jgi:hypothetical protein
VIDVAVRVDRRVQRCRIDGALPELLGQLADRAHGA